MITRTAEKTVELPGFEAFMKVTSKALTVAVGYALVFRLLLMFDCCLDIATRSNLYLVPPYSVLLQTFR